MIHVPVREHTLDPRVAESIVRDTGAPMDLVLHLYQEELEAIAERARITEFLHVLASRRARLRLRRRS
jgi:hypothetical protein